MIVSNVPILVVDIAGSLAMIVFSLLSLNLARRLRNRDRTNVIWTYLLWVCYALTLFAVSRSAGHIVKQLLLYGGRSELWYAIRPVSGSLNTLAFLIAGAVTLFFQHTWNIYREITGDRMELQHTRDELLYLNQNLEDLVVERTRELARSEHKYRRMFEISRDTILVSDRAGAIQDLNPIGYGTLGAEDAGAELLGQPLQNFMANEAEWEKILKAMDEEGFVANAEIELKHADGSTFRALITGSLDRDSDRHLETVHLLIKDIEGRRRMENQMAQADKLASIGEFSAGIAHEINNPLGIILGYTQLMLREEPKETERYRDLKTVEKHVRNCKSIVEDLLNFARSSQPRKEAVHLREIIDEVAGFVEQHSRSDRLKIEKSYDPAMPPMILDEKKIRQVFMNLIVNATHAVGEKGTIRLETRFDPDSRKAIIRVIDNGCGIEKKNLSRIFDPFFTTKPTGQGTGLGLSVSYGIVKNHEGDIQVESTVGKGSVFTITLPAAPKEPAPAAFRERETLGK